MKLVCCLIAALYSAISLANNGNIAVTELSGNVFILKAVGDGTNIGLLKTAKGVVLIDPMPGNENLDALKNIITKLTGGSASFILNTHKHSDHTGGNAYFIDRGGVLLADASIVAEMVQMLATSHSNEDNVFFHAKSNVVFVGDIYDTSWHPTFYAGGVSGFNHAIDAILQLGNDDSIIVPGHGKPTGKAELHAFRQNTLAWVNRVEKLKHEGKTTAEIKNDTQIKAILEKFNIDRKADFIPEKALVRFIERTLTMIENSE